MGSQCLEGWSDAALVSVALAGDKDAFAELVVRHRPTAVAVTARLLNRPDLAADAVQEAVVLAMVGLDRLQAPDRFGAWLCGISLNVARRWLRELRGIVLTPDAGPVGDGAPGPAELVEAAAISAEVRRAVEGLAQGQRDAVLLFYLQGLTHREVAAELAISVGAVKARLHQARAALAPRLAPLIETEETTVTKTAKTRDWVEMTVREVRRDDSADAASRRHVIVLGEVRGDRELPIWVGSFEATAIALSLEATEAPRPMTYQFAASLVAATGSRVEQIRITGLTYGVFYAIVVVHGPDGGEVDARPSDALNLALVTDAPIHVDAAVLDDAGATDQHEWRDYPEATTLIVNEVRQARGGDREEATMTTESGASEPSETDA
ncbi:MAG: bifunctional nuclease domain-containing protein [Nocardioidaceae bacterium]